MGVLMIKGTKDYNGIANILHPAVNLKNHNISFINWNLMKFGA
jgi:hypothetical protein